MSPVGRSESGLRSRGRTKRRPTGFALVIVLWVLAGLTVVAVAVASSAQSSTESVKLLRERVRAEAAFMSTSARIKVIAATGLARPMSISGLKGTLLVDGRYATVAADESVSIRDIRALLDLNRGSETYLLALTRYCGAGENQSAELVDALGDYIDQDGNKRLNGAEAFEYRLVGEPEPRNAALLSREELWRVKGWSSIRASWQSRGCDELVTTHGDRRFNTRTASATMLEIVGYTPDAAAAAVEGRREGFDVVSTSTSGEIPGSAFGAPAGFVGSTFRVTHRLASTGWLLSYDLALTPRLDGGPWRMHEVRYRPGLPPTPETASTTQLPAPDLELTESERKSLNVLSTSPFAN